MTDQEKLPGQAVVGLAGSVVEGAIHGISTVSSNASTIGTSVANWGATMGGVGLSAGLLAMATGPMIASRMLYGIGMWAEEE